MIDAWTSQYDESTWNNLTIIGDIPDWLEGNFISNGPGQFEIGNLLFNHWFDGFALLKKFRFNNKKVYFQTKFLKTDEYVESKTRGKLSVNEFGTYSTTFLPLKIKNALISIFKQDKRDNCIINTAHLGGHYVAMTESVNMVAFDLNSLATIGKFSFDDKLRGHLSTGHPISSTNILLELGIKNKYHIYTADNHNKTRKIIHTYTSDRAFYMHSFSMTPNFIILLKSPLTLSKLKLKLGLPFNNSLYYEPKFTSYIVVIDRSTGQEYEIATEPFVCIHTINAYEENDTITLDMICHKDGNPYNKLYLTNLKSNNPKLPLGQIKRYQIFVNKKQCINKQLTYFAHEFPKINNRYNGVFYKFVYTSIVTQKDSKFFDTIQKFNMQTHEKLQFSKPNYYFGEACFVEKFNGHDEDDGVLLVLAWNQIQYQSSLMIIDAINMNLITEILLPIHLPFGLHGNFYK